MFDVRFFNFLLNVVDPFRIIRNYMITPIATMIYYTYEDYKTRTQEKLVSTQNMVLRIFVTLTSLFLLVSFLQSASSWRLITDLFRFAELC